MGIPSAPRNLKVYKEPVNFQPFLNESLPYQYFIKWKKPIEPQGPIQNYVLIVKCEDKVRQYEQVQY